MSLCFAKQGEGWLPFLFEPASITCHCFSLPRTCHGNVCCCSERSTAKVDTAALPHSVGSAIKKPLQRVQRGIRADKPNLCSPVSRPVSNNGFVCCRPKWSETDNPHRPTRLQHTVVITIGSLFDLWTIIARRRQRAGWRGVMRASTRQEMPAK